MPLSCRYGGLLKLDVSFGENSRHKEGVKSSSVHSAGGAPRIDGSTRNLFFDALVEWSSAGLLLKQRGVN